MSAEISPTLPLTHVQITKVADLGSFPGGHPNIDEGYTLKGVVSQWPPVVGEPLVVFRYERNGLAILGRFTTSQVESVTSTPDGKEWAITSQNSTYIAEILLDPLPASVLELWTEGRV